MLQGIRHVRKHLHWQQTTYLRCRRRRNRTSRGQQHGRTDIGNYLLALAGDNTNVVTGVIYDDSQAENLIVTVIAKEKYSGHLVVPDHPEIARWVADIDDDRRSIPAFERKKWFLDANESKIG